MLATILITAGLVIVIEHSWVWSLVILGSRYTAMIIYGLVPLMSLIMIGLLISRATRIDPAPQQVSRDRDYLRAIKCHASVLIILLATFGIVILLEVSDNWALGIYVGFISVFILYGVVPLVSLLTISFVVHGYRKNRSTSRASKNPR